MAHPADTAPKGPVFANARLTPDEADRLASMFRPSWELDDAPFTGAGTLTGADMRALQSTGGGVRADVHAAAFAEPAVAFEPPHSNGSGSTTSHGNGSHAVPAPAPIMRDEPSVVIAATPPPAPATHQGVVRNHGQTIMGMQAPGGMRAPVFTPPAAPPPTISPSVPVPAPVSVQAPVSEAPRIPPSRPSQRPSAPNFVIGPPTPRAQPVAVRRSVSADVDGYPKKSQTGLFVGIGAAAALVLGIGIWALSSGASDPPKDATPTATAAKPTEDPLSAVPPPPVVTAAVQTATATQAAPPAAPAPTAPSAPTPQVVTTPVSALPVAPPPHAAAPPPPPHYGAGAAASPPPAPHPAGRKNGPTIVRDVPF